MVNGVLHLYHRPIARAPGEADTVMDHIRSFGRYSRFGVWEVNTELGMPSGLRDLSFSAVVLHYSLFGIFANYKLDPDFRAYLREQCGESFTVAFFQDEFFFCQDRFAFLNEFGIDCVYSCVEPERLDAVYGTYTEVPVFVRTSPATSAKR